MDPLSALIGGGISLLGGLMNRSAVRASNAANLQQQMSMATGAYLPALRANAEAAGFNPLAVLGLHTPDMAVSRPADASSGVMRLGEFASQSLSPHNVEMEKLAEEKEKTSIELGRQQINNASIEAARNLQAFRMLHENPDKYLPAGLTEKSTQSGFGIPQVERAGEFLSKWGNRFPTWGDVMPSYKWIETLPRPPAASGTSDLERAAPTFNERYQLW